MNMPEEIFIIVVVAIIAGTFSGFVKMVLEYLKDRQATERPTVGATDALTTSELERLIEAAVDRANRGVVDRLDALEDRMEDAQLLKPAEGRLSLPEPDGEENAGVPVPRTRIRS